MDLVSWAFTRIDEWRDRPIYVNASDPDESLNAAQVKDYALKLIAGLAQRGVRGGETVCVLSYNNILYTSLFLGIIGAGARFVGANPAYTEGELKHLFSIAEVKLVLAEPDFLEKARSAALAAGLDDSAVLALDASSTGGSADHSSWRSLLQHGRRDWVRISDEKLASGTVASLMMTSGTTGLPKAAAMSHYAHIEHARMSDDAALKPYQVRRLLSLPQFHSFTIPLFHLQPLRRGYTTYVMRRFDLDQYLHGMKQHDITETAMVPPMIHSILSSNEAQQANLGSLRHILCAGSPLPGTVQSRFAQLLDPEAVVSQVWGMTETAWITTFRYPENDRTGSVGRLISGVRARVVSPSGTELGENFQGEILVKSPALMMGYLNNPAATENTLANGWLRTGDIGYHKDGKWYITDREKDLIKVRAWQVSPTEIEACLLQHPCVQDAAVIGVQPSAATGELPRAYIIPRPGFDRRLITEAELQDHVAQRLARFKALAGGVRFVDAIPRNASGKILRKTLRQMAVAELAGGVTQDGLA